MVCRADDKIGRMSKSAKLQAPRHDAEQVAGVRTTGFARFRCGFEVAVSLELFAELFAEPDVGVTSMKGLGLPVSAWTMGTSLPS